MAIKRFTASADTTITNAYEANLSTRGTGANMGASDILEAFVIHGQAKSEVSSANAEQARVLIKFPTTTISTARTNNEIPTSGNVKFFLRLFNAPHGNTLPEDFTLEVNRITSDWDEGRGLDMDEYTDLGQANWTERKPSTDWTSDGGDFSTPTFTVSFPKGTEDVEIEITSLVEDWLDATYDNYGLIIKNITADIDGDSGSLYTKKFFGKGTEFFFKKPTIEARWNSARKDNRSNFALSSSLAPAADNLNTIYLYNRVRGELTDIPGLTNNTLDVTVFSSSVDGVPVGDPVSLVRQDGVVVTKVVASRVTELGSNLTGVYSATFATTNTTTPLADVWSTGSAGTLVNFHTGSVDTSAQSATTVDSVVSYVSEISNLKSSYTTSENPRFRLFIRSADWSPTIYTVANATSETSILEAAYYEVFRITDDTLVVPFGTGSSDETKMSYDTDGNYFDFDMSILESGYAYGIRLAYYLQGQYKKQSEVFKFRVQD